MKRKKVLSVFVDESGRFKYPDPESHYYIVGLVFHDQDVDITPLVRKMDQKADELGLDTDVFAFHAGPIIRQEKGYEIMNRVSSRTRPRTRPFRGRKSPRLQKKI